MLNKQKGEEDVVRPVKTMLVKETGNKLTHRFPGKVEAPEVVDLSFRVSGNIIEFPVKEGQEVAKGDLIARLDPRDFKTEINNVRSQLRQAQAQLKAMQAGERTEVIRSLEAQVNSAEAKYNEAELNYKRYEQLYQGKVVSKMEYDNAVANRDVANAALETARQNLEKGRKGSREEEIEAQKSLIESLEASLQKAENALKDTRLRAPFAGRVSMTYVDNHQDIVAKAKIIKLQNLSDSIQVAISVPERLLVKYRPNDLDVTVSFEFLPGKSFPAEPTELTSEADSKTRTFNATVIMQPVDGVTILPGMTAVVTMVLKDPSSKGTIYVPQEAVFGDTQNLSWIWKFDPETAKVDRTQVHMGRLIGDSVEIVDGLNPGDRIVTAGVHYLEEGQEVRLMNEDKGRKES